MLFRSQLSPEAIDRVCAEAWPEPRNADELHDALVLGGFVTDAEAADCWRPWFELLVAERRATTVHIGAADSGGDSRLWVAAERLGQVLRVVPAAQPEPLIDAVDGLRGGAESVESALVELVRSRLGQRNRVARLEAILQIAARWYETHEMEPLLVEIAEASTRLLDADRASIFLWDRRSHTLEARPALGVEGGQLHVPDDRGVVGQVVQTGEPMRVDRTVDQDQIDRDVDQRLGYETRTLLCVPLDTSGGQRLGAFELMNKRGGNFTNEDETALVELAAHAALAIDAAQQRGELVSSRREMASEAAKQVRLIGVSPAAQTERRKREPQRRRRATKFTGRKVIPTA